MSVEQQGRPVAPPQSEGTAIEAAGRVAEVQAAVTVAQQRPRDVQRALDQMRAACSTQALADRAFWSLPRGGKKLEGSSVHLARELARCWGNVDYGIRELRRDDDAGVSEMVAWAWDQENNVRSGRSFIVPHARMARQQRQKLTDLGDIANNNNSVAARAVRETIFTVLPVWFRDEAEARCAATLSGESSGETREQQVSKLIGAFGDLGVTRQQLERHLERDAGQWSPQDLGMLRVIGGELRRGEKRVEDVFPRSGVSAQDITARKHGEQNPSDQGPDHATSQVTPGEQTPVVEDPPYDEGAGS